MSPDRRVLGRTVIAEPLVERERASATPVLREPSDRRRPGGWPPDGTAALPVREQAGPGSTAHDADALPTLTTLRSHQLWFTSAIMSPSPDLETTAWGAGAILTAGPRLSAKDRLGVYHRAYTARLVECLADDYPALRSALGEERFETLCRAYIVRHPSTSPSLNAYGRHMAEFCRGGMEASLAACCREAADPGFMADLAALEWAIVEVIHAKSTDPLTPAGLADVPLDRWSDARLEMTPAVRLLRFAYPVNTYLQALRQGEGPIVPGPTPSAAAVYRSGPTIWRMDLSEPMVQVLDSLASGETLGAALDRAASALSDVSEEIVTGRVMEWFREWVSSGLFSGVTF